MYAKVMKDSAASTKAWKTRTSSGGKSKRGPLQGHPYHDKTDNELKGIIRDAGEAAKLQRGMSSETKYLDQVNDASTVLYSRRSKKTDTNHIGSVAAALGLT